MPSRSVSLKLPVLALHSGDLIASVMTMSSGFFCVLHEIIVSASVYIKCDSYESERNAGKRWDAHILSSGFWLGEICERTLERR